MQKGPVDLPTNSIQPKFEDLKEIKCSCGQVVFRLVCFLRDISPIQAPTGQRTLANVPLGYQCVNCEKVITLNIDIKTNDYIWLEPKQQS
jgi:hypothetical protein